VDVVVEVLVGVKVIVGVVAGTEVDVEVILCVVVDAGVDVELVLAQDAKTRDVAMKQVNKIQIAFLFIMTSYVFHGIGLNI